jgi:hypothetical protein
MRLKTEQKKALFAYKQAIMSEERYLGSVFVCPAGQRDKEQRTHEAFIKCLKTGIDRLEVDPLLERIKF